jgi:hypothetical protein
MVQAFVQIRQGKKLLHEAELNQSGRPPDNFRVNPDHSAIASPRATHYRLQPDLPGDGDRPKPPAAKDEGR